MINNNTNIEQIVANIIQSFILIIFHILILLYTLKKHEHCYIYVTYTSNN